MSTGEPERAKDTGSTRRVAVPLVLFLLFLGPLALASFLYFGGPDLRPQNTTNHGKLVLPPVPLPALEGPAGTLLRDVWTLVYIGAVPCGDGCRETLRETRQVRLALGRKSERVRRLFVNLGTDDVSPELLSEHPDLSIVPVDPEHSALLEAFSPGNGTPMESHRVYIVDPLGNLMMVYPLDADPNGLLEDLERLLRLSHIG